MPLMDAGLVGGAEGVAIPHVVVAARVVVVQVTAAAVEERGVAIDMVAGREIFNTDATEAVADGLVVVQVVVAG